MIYGLTSPLFRSFLARGEPFRFPRANAPPCERSPCRKLCAPHDPATSRIVPHGRACGRLLEAVIRAAAREDAREAVIRAAAREAVIRAARRPR